MSIFEKKEKNLNELIEKLNAFTSTYSHSAYKTENIKTEKNALLKQYQKLFQMENTKLEFRENALKSIAQKAISLKTGARGLRSIIENILMDTMFELPSEPDINEVVINEEVVKKGTKPILVHEKNTKEIKNTI